MPAVDGKPYVVDESAAQQFRRDGYCVLPDFLSAEECDALEARYDTMTHPSDELRATYGRDYGDHSQGHGVPPEQFVLINVNNPSRHLPAFGDNPFAQRCAAVAEKLIGDGIAQDYDQLLEKLPNRPAAVFPWHQDMQYWPKHAPGSTRTATFSLALTDADMANGCLRVVPGSGTAKKLVQRPDAEARERDAANDDHAAANSSRDATADERAIVLGLTADEAARVLHLPAPRGTVTVHDEWIVHGSGGNTSDRVRKTYVIAYRDAETVKYERREGFSHSYNDDPETLKRVRSGAI